MFGLSDNWTKIVSALIIAFITSIVTHRLAIAKERRLQTDKQRFEILNNVYIPLYRAFINKQIKDIGKPFGYLGIDEELFHEINKIYEDNIHLIDPALEARIWELKDHFSEEQRRMEEMGDNTPVQGDYEYRMIRYVFYHYNKMRRRLKLPYEKTYLKYHDIYEKIINNTINYFKGRKIKRDLEKYRKKE
ncbi:hypothetical protein GCM10011389_33330 [Pontibacillus salipaludis]|uniref:Uncharacterized protein n=2 Tax=Pontibacillus salipaludis TaxID=1697394 RepID=A0ABQ1QET3_9BACI|nr:hypothetical protein GCM10011389_33330 [Pontibacillus salipaludis]